MSVQQVYSLSCATSSVSTSAYTQITPACQYTSSKIQVMYFGSENHLLYLAVGPAGQEVPVALISNIVAPALPFTISAGTRLSVIAVDAAVSSGYVAVALLGS